VERGDLTGWPRDFIAQDSQQTAVLAAQDDATQEDRKTGALLRGEIDDPVAFDPGFPAVALADRAHREAAQRDIALWAGDEAAAGFVQLAPPSVIDIGLVENIGGTRLDRLSAAGHHVVDGRRSNLQTHRPVGVRIIDDVSLQSPRSAVPIGPFMQACERDRRGIDQPQNLRAVTRQRAVRQFAELGKGLGKYRTGPPPIGIRQSRAANRSAPQVVMVRRLCIPHRLHFAQARQAAELSRDQRHQMVPGREPLDVFVPFVPFDDRCKPPPWKRYQQITEHCILVAHAKLSFLSLVSQKDTAKPGRCLACSYYQLTHSPDSPARKRESRDPRTDAVAPVHARGRLWTPAFAGVTVTDWKHARQVRSDIQSLNLN